MKKIIYSIFIIAVFPGCRQQSEGERMTDMSATSVESIQPSSAPSGNIDINNNTQSAADTSIERKLIKDATLRWETGDIRKTHADLIKSTDKLKGYISDDSQTADDNETTVRLEIHIPVNEFDAFLSSLEKEVSKFDEKNIKNNQLVTLKYNADSIFPDLKLNQKKYLLFDKQLSEDCFVGILPNE